MLQRHLLTRHSIAFCHAEFPSEALAQRLRLAGKTARFVLALVLLKVVHSGSVFLQVRHNTYPCMPDYNFMGRHHSDHAEICGICILNDGLLAGRT